MIQAQPSESENHGCGVSETKKLTAPEAIAAASGEWDNGGSNARDSAQQPQWHSFPTRPSPWHDQGCGYSCPLPLGAAHLLIRIFGLHIGTDLLPFQESLSCSKEPESVSVGCSQESLQSRTPPNEIKKKYKKTLKVEKVDGGKRRSRGTEEIFWFGKVKRSFFLVISRKPWQQLLLLEQDHIRGSWMA